MAASWVPPLLDGLTAAGGDGLLSDDHIGQVFYGDLFRRPDYLLGSDEIEDLDATDLDDPMDIDVFDSWWTEAASTDPGVPSPNERTLGPIRGVQAALAALACSRFLAGAAEQLLILWLKQVRQYFTDSAIRTAVQERFAQQVSPDTEVVVAHSLGTVVAYEALCAHTEWDVRGLVTLGSPLGIRNLILDRLVPPPFKGKGRWQAQWPGNVQRWTNIADRTDFVALVKKLDAVFGSDVKCVEIDNGVQMHSATRYLTAEATGEAILASLSR
jgi:hypothetical protein